MVRVTYMGGGYGACNPRPNAEGDAPLAVPLLVWRVTVRVRVGVRVRVRVIAYLDPLVSLLPSFIILGAPLLRLGGDGLGVRG